MFSYFFSLLHCCLLFRDVCARWQTSAVVLYPSLSGFLSLPVLGWPVLMFLFGSRSPPPERDGKESWWILLSTLCAETSLTALPHTEPWTERLLKVFLFFITFRAKSPGLHSPFDKALFILYSYCVERGQGFFIVCPDSIERRAACTVEWLKDRCNQECVIKRNMKQCSVNGIHAVICYPQRWRNKSRKKRNAV